METGIIFLSIFGGIIAILIGVAIYGSRKDKKKKSEALKDLQKKETDSKDNHDKTYVILGELIKYIDTNKKIFNENPEKISLSSVNKKIIDVLSVINKSDELKDIYKSEDRKSEFKPIIDELSKIKPSNWRKEAFFSISLIEGKSKFIKLDEENTENKSIKKIKEFLWKN